MKSKSLPSPNPVETLESRTLFSTPVFSYATAALSVPRRVLGVALGDKAIFAGGIGANRDAPLSAVDIYDAGTGQWTASQLPVPNDGVGFAIGEKVVFVGANTETYNPAIGKWTSLPSPLDNGNNEIQVGRFILTTNLFLNGPADPLQAVYDSRKGRWSNVRLRGLQPYGTGTVVGNTAYFSAYVASTPNAQFPNNLVSFNADTGKWGVVDLPASAGAAVIGSVGESVVMQGGTSGPEFVARFISIYNTRTGVTVTTPLSQPRAGATVATIGSKIYLFSGTYNQFSPHPQPSAMVDVFDDVSGSWSTLICPTDISRDTSAERVGDKLIFTTGDVFDAGTNQWSTTTVPRGIGFAAVGTQGIFAGNVTFGPSEGERTPQNYVDVYTDLSPSPVLSGGLTGSIRQRDKVTVLNTGDADLAGGYTIQLYASPDRTLGGAILVGSLTVAKPLLAGASSPFNIRTVIPKGMPGGTYHLLAAVQDGSGNITPIAAEDATFRVHGPKAAPGGAFTGLDRAGRA